MLFSTGHWTQRWPAYNRLHGMNRALLTVGRSHIKTEARKSSPLPPCSRMRICGPLAGVAFKPKRTCSVFLLSHDWRLLVVFRKGLGTGPLSRPPLLSSQLPVCHCQLGNAPSFTLPLPVALYPSVHHPLRPRPLSPPVATSLHYSWAFCRWLIFGALHQISDLKVFQPRSK